METSGRKKSLISFPNLYGLECIRFLLGNNFSNLLPNKNFSIPNMLMLQIKVSTRTTPITAGVAEVEETTATPIVFVFSLFS